MQGKHWQLLNGCHITDKHGLWVHVAIRAEGLSWSVQPHFQGYISLTMVHHSLHYIQCTVTPMMMMTPWWWWCGHCSPNNDDKMTTVTTTTWPDATTTTLTMQLPWWWPNLTWQWQCNLMQQQQPDLTQPDHCNNDNTDTDTMTTPWQWQ
jgi:hypothetical protein